MLKAAFADLPGITARTWDDRRSNRAAGGAKLRMRQAASLQRLQRERCLVTEPQFDGGAGEYPFHFLPYASQAFLDGSLAHLPWLQELPDVISTAMWSSWVEINPEDRSGTRNRTGRYRRNHIESGQHSGAGILSPGIAPDVIAMPVGQGHQTFTRYASGRGSNPISILAPSD